MTKERLSQMRYLNKEIELLQNQLKNTEPETTVDSVKGSSVHFPYTMHTIKIEGVDTEEYNRKIRRIRNRLQKRLEEVMELREEIEEFTDTIDDSLIRQIITLRYINGLTWEQIAFSVGEGVTADSVRKKHDRFLKNI